MARHRLPDRRRAFVLQVQPDLGSRVIYTVSVGYDETGVREVFISCNKLTSAANFAGLELAVLISIALQHGANLRELATALPRENDGKPQGAAGAILDAILDRAADIDAAVKDAIDEAEAARAAAAEAARKAKKRKGKKTEKPS